MKLFHAVVILLLSTIFIMILKKSTEGLKTFDDLHPKLNTKLKRREKGIGKKTKK